LHLDHALHVSWTLANEEKKKYLAWRPAWEAKLQPADKKLLTFTNKQRIAIVKRGAAKTKSEVTHVPIAELLSIRTAIPRFTTTSADCPARLPHSHG
jgi:hypothetical protein